MPGGVVARSNVRIEVDQMPRRRFYVPVNGVEEGPFVLGMHGEVAQYRNVDLATLDPDALHATTYDYLVGAVGGCMMGLMAIGLEGRGIPTRDGNLVAEATGELMQDEESNAVLLRRIHVKYILSVDPAKLESAERVLNSHLEHCSMVRSLSPALEFSTSLEVRESAPVPA